MAGQSEAEDAAKTTTAGRSPGPPQAAGRVFCSVFGLALAGHVLKFYCSSELVADPAVRCISAVPADRLPVQPLPVRVP